MNPVRYTSREFDLIKADLIAQLESLNPTWTSRGETDPGITIMEVQAYLLEQVNFFIDKMMNESFPATALQRRSLIVAGKTFGYVPGCYEPCRVQLTFSIDQAHNEDIVIPQFFRCAGSKNGESIPFYTLEEATIPAGISSITVSAVQGIRTSQITPTSGFRRYKLVSNNVSSNPDYIEVSVDDVVWTYVTSFKDSQKSDTHYTIEVDEDNNVFVVFGNSYYGKIPTNGTITFKFNSNKGEAGTMAPLKVTMLTDQVAGQYGSFVRVTNAQSASGGSDPRTEDYLRYIVMAMSRMQDRAITKADLTAVVDASGYVTQTKILDVHDDRSIGYYMAKIYVVVPGGLTDEIEELLSAYINNYRYMTLGFEIAEPVEFPLAVDIGIRIYPSASYNIVANAVNAAVSSFLAPREIGTTTGLDIGQAVRYSDLVALVDGIRGVDYCTVNINSSQVDVVPELNELVTPTITISRIS